MVTAETLVVVASSAKALVEVFCPFLETEDSLMSSTCCWCSACENWASSCEEAVRVDPLY